MTLTRQIMRLMRPLTAKVNSLIVRAVINAVRADGSLQIEGFAGDDRDGVPNIQQYGFFSFPPKGAQAVVLGPSGSRAASVCVATDDLENKPAGGVEGTGGLWTKFGQMILLDEKGRIICTTPLLKSTGDVADLFSTMDELRTWAATHVHTSAVPGQPTSPPTTQPPREEA
jgi:phage baseplate assembly protein V